jgi:RNA polymerase sigma factor (sigma-70 family)
VNPGGLLQRRRPAPRPEQQLEELRPFGIAYFLRCFGEQLGHADAEDAVATVVLRLHRQIEAGNSPECLRATFLKGVRNAGIDQLRARARRPTLAIEAAADVPLSGPTPEEVAERDEAAARLHEALARTRSKYREVILLRFGADMTVLEIAEQLQVTMPAAKKLLMRATRQARQRLEGIEAEIFCEQMREETRRIVDKQLAGLADSKERRILDAHLSHCGSCRSFLARLHSDLHELGSSALVLAGAERSGALGRLGEWLSQADDALHAATDRARYAAFKSSGALQAGDGSAGAIAGSAQKVVAVCGAATATAATCLATGLIGPGVGVSAVPAKPDHHRSPAPVVRRLSSIPSAEAPVTYTPAPVQSPESEAQPAAKPAEPAPQTAPEPEPQPSPSQEATKQFGFESSAPEPAAEPAPAPAPRSPSPASPESSAPASAGGSGGGESFGFEG